MHKKTCSQLMVFISFPVEEIIIPCSYCALFINILHKGDNDDDEIVIIIIIIILILM
jgi:hypothetical protein